MWTYCEGNFTDPGPATRLSSRKWSKRVELAEVGVNMPCIQIIFMKQILKIHCFKSSNATFSRFEDCLIDSTYLGVAKSFDNFAVAYTKANEIIKHQCCKALCALRAWPQGIRTFSSWWLLSQLSKCKCKCKCKLMFPTPMKCYIRNVCHNHFVECSVTLKIDEHAVINVYTLRPLKWLGGSWYVGCLGGVRDFDHLTIWVGVLVSWLVECSI